MLSIITNFGCDTGCKYCIFEDHPMSKHKTTVENFNWKKLRRMLEKYDGDTISVSGGGDPFFQPKRNFKWWVKLYWVCEGLGVKLEVHTSKLPVFSDFKFSKYVLHTTITKFNNLHEQYLKISKTESLRLVIVVTDDIVIDDIIKITKFCKINQIQLSFRQMIKEDKSTSYHLHEYLSNPVAYWFYIEQCDYNTYFMPDNNIYDKYLF